mmetsp:Transcript_20907/g.42609  ORF Transcript_20907/g.42609 Transcript_20907/m.42609 type:complete len:888 (+) Transcript_20907:64-2727(+)
MRISKHSFGNRRNTFAAIIGNSIPASLAKLFSIGRLPFAIVAGALLYLAFSFATQCIGLVERKTHQSGLGNAPLITDTSLWLRGPNSKLQSTDDSPLAGFKPGITAAEEISKKPKILPRKSKLTPPNDSLFTVFYNLFIPTEAISAANAVEVLTEQLEQVAGSLRRFEEGEKNSKSAVVYYNLIGNNEIYPMEKISDLCKSLHPGLSCQLLNFFETASEAATLLDIYQFCQNDDKASVQRTNNDTRVVYIHSKGSYHSSTHNNNWRREMTNSVLHQDCLFPPNDACDVCGAQFYTRFSFMFPGNMWTAKCSYIQKLLSPEKGGLYEKLKRESIVKFFKLRLWGQLNSTLMEDRVDYFGLGRYQLEHWIGSHASVQPCELHKKNVTFETMILGMVNSAYDYEWSMGAPREEVISEIPNARQKLEENEDAQFREYFYLPGNLIKWFSLYGKDGVPSQNSWVWNFFPGGHKWRNLVRDYGENALDEMVKQSSPGYHSAFTEGKEKNNNYDFDQDVEILSDPNDPVVVFYQISFPEGRKKEAILTLKAQFDVLSLGQYNIITRYYDKKRPVLIYYSVSGGSPSNVEFVSSLCKSKSPRVTCRKLDHFRSTDVKGETLQQLHRFCRSKPSSKVTYVTNQLPREYGVNRTETFSIQKVRAYTTAATSKMCLKSRDKCNVCGMEFYPLPFQHFAGNMFSASCGYVKNLIPPEQFEVAMNHIADDVLINHLERAFTTELTPFTPRNLGLHQYSIEHWIGSHPDFKPCDVAPVTKSWFPFLTGRSYIPNDYSSSRVYDFLWGLAPRRSSIPPNSRRFSERKESIVQRRDEFIFREYYYLAGNLHRWYKLYNKAPPITSWVWQWFPKGDDWWRGNVAYGSNVVEKLTEPFTDEGVAH